jgi:hypothetical protein
LTSFVMPSRLPFSSTCTFMKGTNAFGMSR